jgi:hypothetical protein
MFAALSRESYPYQSGIVMYPEPFAEDLECLVAPDLRISSWVVTKIAAAVRERFCSFGYRGDHDVHQIFQTGLAQIDNGLILSLPR